MKHKFSRIHYCIPQGSVMFCSQSCQTFWIADGRPCACHFVCLVGIFPTVSHKGNIKIYIAGMMFYAETLLSSDS